MNRQLALILLPVAALLISRAGLPAYQAPPLQPHHSAAGFINPWPGLQSEHGFADVFKWYRGRPESSPRYRESLGRFPLREPDRTVLDSPGEGLQLTWLGHASFLVQLGGFNILTDPHLGERASPVSWAGPRRITAAPLSADQLPPIDVVVISHNHYDHLDKGTVLALGNGPAWYVPLGLKNWLNDQGITHVVELDWWQESTLPGGLSVTCLPARHFSSRTLWDRDKNLWAGWWLEAAGRRVYFAGDTDYGPHFAAIGRRLGPPDVALLPIGAYRPRWFMAPVHVDPAEAVQAHRDLGAERSIAMHWGTFILAAEPVDEPPRLYRAAAESAGLSPDQAVLLEHGQTLVLP